MKCAALYLEPDEGLFVFAYTLCPTRSLHSHISLYGNGENEETNRGSADFGRGFSVALQLNPDFKKFALANF